MKFFFRQKKLVKLCKRKEKISVGFGSEEILEENESKW